MSDGIGDGLREREIGEKLDEGLVLIEAAMILGGYDPIFGVNGAVIREMNARLRKYGIECREKKR